MCPVLRWWGGDLQLGGGCGDLLDVRILGQAEGFAQLGQVGRLGVQGRLQGGQGRNGLCLGRAFFQRQGRDDGFQEFIHRGFLVGVVKAKGRGRSACERLQTVICHCAHKDGEDRAVRGVAEDGAEVQVLAVLDQLRGAGGVFDTPPQAGAFAPFEVQETAGSGRGLAVLLFL
ncbi:hypothetical protein BFV99_28065 [Pseudomonas aeruginosa]|nr:hypothetical protein BFV99_28065 [Pseudomonas aeruginosa]